MMDVKWPFYPCNKTPRGWTRSSRMVLSAVGIYSKIWAGWMNRIDAYNRDGFLKAVNRPKDTPLITFSNHKSCFDDPVLWGNAMTWRHMTSDTHKLRWILAASDIVFTREWHSKFFSRGRCVPIIRGGGVNQQGMDFMVEKLNAGEWVHTFPEGKVNMTDEYLRLKWGIGRLIAECKNTPIIIPIWHIGMDTILPNHGPYIPRIGKRVTLVYGNPIDLADTLRQLRDSNSSPMDIRKTLTDILQDEFYKLKTKTEELHRIKN